LRDRAQYILRKARVSKARVRVHHARRGAGGVRRRAAPAADPAPGLPGQSPVRCRCSGRASSSCPPTCASTRCPRSHASPGRMRTPQRQQSTRPAATSGTHTRRRRVHPGGMRRPLVWVLLIPLPVPSSPRARVLVLDDGKER
jgi:hypothetical protein